MTSPSRMLMGPMAMAATRLLVSSGAGAADDMQILREKIKTDKKLLVAAHMELTEGEARGFWPLYEEYQARLQAIKVRLAAMIVDYAREYKAGSLTDDEAGRLLDSSLTVEQDEVKLKRLFVPRLLKLLPPRKVARYVQFENKIPAIARYELAANVPLARTRWFSSCSGAHARTNVIRRANRPFVNSTGN